MRMCFSCDYMLVQVVLRDVLTRGYYWIHLSTGHAFCTYIHQTKKCVTTCICIHNIYNVLLTEKTGMYNIVRI